VVTKHLNEGLSSVPIDFTCLCDVVTHLGQMLLIKINKIIERSFTNVEGAQRGEEIIADEKAEKHKVINDTLYIKSHSHLSR